MNMNVIFNAFNEHGVLITVSHYEVDIDRPFDELVKEFVLDEDFIGIGGKCFVEMVDGFNGNFGSEQFPMKQIGRNWFSVELREIPKCHDFYVVDEDGVKTKVNMVHRVRVVQENHVGKPIEFSTDGIPDTGIRFYEMAAVIPFFSKYDKFRFNGYDYVQEVTPSRGELVITKIMGA